MAAILFFLVFFLTLSPPFFEQQTNLVEANDELIKILCHFAPLPSLCLECVQSDPNAPKTDQFDIASILVGCLTNNAANIESMLTLLTIQTQNKGLEKASKDCIEDTFVDGKKALSDAVALLKKHDCKGAIKEIEVALAYHFTCDKYLNGFEVDIPSDLQLKMKVYEQLSDVAIKIIGHKTLSSKL